MVAPPAEKNFLPLLQQGREEELLVRLLLPLFLFSKADTTISGLVLAVAVVLVFDSDRRSPTDGAGLLMPLS